MKVPSVSASVDTVLYVYYGNGSAPNQQDPPGVWDANYHGVWHLGENAALPQDSTSYANNATSGTLPTQTAAFVGNGQSFNGTSNSVGIPHSASLAIGANGTFSIWFTWDEPRESNLFEKGGTGGYTGWQSGTRLWWGPQFQSASRWSTSSPLMTGQWYRLDGVNEAGIKKLYLNGTLAAQSTSTFAFNNNGTLQLGNGVDGLLKGSLDEFRVSNVVRSLAWIQTEYNNQNSPSTFLSLGVEQIPQPSIGVALDASPPTDNADGTFDVTYTLNIENLGETELFDIQVTDDLTTAFGTLVATVGEVDSPGEYTVTSGPTITANSAAPLTPNAGFDGSGDSDLLNVAAGGSLGVGETVTIDLTVRFFPDINNDPFATQATVTADSSADGTADGDVSDLSDDGTDPDPDGDNNPNESGENDPTQLTIDVPIVGVAKALTSFTQTGPDTFQVSFDLLVENLGATTLTNVQVADDLGVAFTGANSVSVTTGPSVSGGLSTVNSGFNGTTDTDLLDGTESLGVGQTATISFTVTVDTGGNLGPFSNQAIATASTTPGGAPLTTDPSDDGSDPDPDGDSNPNEADENDPTVFLPPQRVVGAAKHVTGVTQVGPTTYRLRFSVRVENLSGTDPADNVQVADDLAAAFPGVARITIFNGPTITGGLSALNAGFDGDDDAGTNPTDVFLLSGDETLAIGQTAKIVFTVEVDLGTAVGPFSNQATATIATTPGGAPIWTDLSDDGTKPDPDGDGNPDEPGENDPTIIAIAVDGPVVGVAQQLSSTTQIGPTTFELGFTVRVENLGSQQLTNLQIAQDLAYTFQGATSFSLTVPATVSGGLGVANAAFDGTSDPNLLSGSETLGVGQSATITFTVTADTGGNSGPYVSQVIATSANSQGGTPTSTDASDNGSDPDPDGDGNPDEPGENDPITINLGGQSITLSKEVDEVVQVGVGRFEAAYTIQVRNLSGSVGATNLQVIDDLAQAFPGVDTITVVSLSSTALSINPSYDGVDDIELLTGEDTLPRDDTASIGLRVRVDVGTASGPFANQASATTAGRPGGPVLTAYDSGPQLTRFESQRIGVAKDVSAIRLVGPTTFEVDHTFVAENLSGAITATNIQLVDDLAAAFPGVASIEVVAGPTTTGLTAASSPPFDDLDNVNLLSGSDSLAPGQRARVEITARVDIGTSPGEFQNQASISAAVSPGAVPLVEDLSDDGPEPDADGDGDPTELGENDSTFVTLAPPSVLVSKSADVREASQGDVVGYTVRVEQLGIFPIPTLTLLDDLPGGFSFVDDTATLVRAGADGALGTADDLAEEIATDGTGPVAFGPFGLAIGEVAQIRYFLRVGSGVALGRFTNVVHARFADELIGNEANAAVDVVSDPIFERTSVIGKVWHDQDGDGWQDEGEEGIPGVRLSSVEGLMIETDPFGRYHMADIEVARVERGAQFILKVDPATLPEGARFTTENPRVMRLTQALMSRMNFGVQLPVSALSAAGNSRSQRGVVWATEDPLVQDPRLDVLALGEATVDGERLVEPISFAMYTNYQAFLTGWELQIFAGEDTDRVRPLAILTGDQVRFDERVPWDGAGVALKAGTELAYVLRVYDEAGRWDETQPRRLAVVQPDFDRESKDDPAAEAEKQARLIYGQSQLATQSIPVTGSRVRVHGRDVDATETVRVNGETVPVSEDGTFVVDLQLPVGSHTLAVELDAGAGRPVTRLLPVEVARDYRFLVGLASLTLGQQSLDGQVEPLAADDHFDEDAFVDGRVAVYARGKIQGKYLITAQLDTTEDELRHLGDRLGDTDPRRIFRQLDPDRYYPVYGDDSTTTTDIDTQGAFYVRLDVDKNQALWGNFNSGLTDTEFLQYNRSLYGAKGRHESTATTSFGDAKTAATVFASEAQSALGHNTFLATGGSLYYLKHTPVVEGSEKVWVEVRRRDTEQVVEREVLLHGRDYEVDPLQGRILLRRPLHQVANDRGAAIIRSRPIEGDTVYLLVDYEFVPTGFLTDDLTYGGRGKAWIGDHVGIGATGLTDERDDINYSLKGVDATLRAGRGTYVTVEYAESEAQQTDAGFVSVDGGLTFATQDHGLQGLRVSGEAVALEGRVNLAEVHETWTGDVRAWTKRRDAGFSTGRLEEGIETEDSGLEALLHPIEGVTLQGGYTSLAKTGLFRHRVARVQGDVQVTETWTAGGELRHEARDNLAAGTAGDATLAGVRVGYQVTPETSVYGSAQTAVASDGMPDTFPSTATGISGLDGFEDPDDQYANDRATIGVSTRLSETVAVSFEGRTGDRGEAVTAGIDVSAGDGTHLNLAGGVGGGATSQIGASYAITEAHDLYGTYAIDPDRTEGAKNTLTVGQRRDFGNRLAIFTEEQFGRGDRLASSAHVFGLDFAGASDWVLSSALQFSDVTRDDQIVERLATSVGASLHRDRIDLTTRVELRHDKGPALETRQYLTSSAFSWQTNDAHRSQAKLNLSWTDDRLSGTQVARFVEFDLGHAFRPTQTDRWNLLGRYSFFYDLSSAGQAMARPDQRSHIVSAETLYALSRRWEIGGKLAVKQGDLRTERDGDGWIKMGRVLSLARARYHFIANWDALVEYRHLSTLGGEDARRGMLAAVYRHLGDQFKVGGGYNFTDFDDDLKDEHYRSNGWFVDIVWKQ